MNVVFLLIAVLAFAALIVFHEFGHFLLARLSGMKVERFAVGFGPVLLSKQVGETEYVVCAVPFGGYVKIAGMEPQEDEEETDPRAYNNKPAWQRFLVIAAGPVFNYVLAAFLFAAVLMMGTLVPDTSQARIGDLVPDEPAAAAGMEPGDRVVAVAGEPITDWESFQEAVSARPGRPTEIEVERNGDTVTLQATPRVTEVDGRTVGMVGVLPATKRVAGESFGPAVAGGFEQTWLWNLRIIDALGGLIRGSEEAKVSGPVAIFKGVSQAAEKGAVHLFLLVAVLSVHLGLFNLLPIPALDGGRLTFLVAEMVRRKPVPPRFEMMVHAVGLVLLLGLMLIVTVFDLRDLFTAG